AAEAGLEAFYRLRPDVVILDRHLPDLDGLDVLERLRSREGTVILLTDQGDIATGARAMQLGAEHVVAKPLDLNHLAVVTARVCDKVRLVRPNVLLRGALEELLSKPRPWKVRVIGKAVETLTAAVRRAVGGGDGGRAGEG